MTIRTLSAIADPDTARAVATMLGRLPGTEPGAAVPDSTALLGMLGRLAAQSVDDLPEVVLVHERIEDTAGLELLRELASRGRIRLRVAATYAPEQAAEAQERHEAGGVCGRLVLTF